MCRSLVDVDLLTTDEREWLNEYHAEVREKTKGFFANDPVTMKWLERETEPY